MNTLKWNLNFHWSHRNGYKLTRIGLFYQTYKMIYLNSIAEDSKLVFKIKIYIPFLRVPIIPFHSGYFNGAKYIQFRTGKLFWMWETISVQNMFSPGLSLEFSYIELVIQWFVKHGNFVLNLYPWVRICKTHLTPWPWPRLHIFASRASLSRLVINPSISLNTEFCWW